MLGFARYLTCPKTSDDPYLNLSCSTLTEPQLVDDKCSLLLNGGKYETPPPPPIRIAIDFAPPYH